MLLLHYFNLLYFRLKSCDRLLLSLKLCCNFGKSAAEFGFNFFLEGLLIFLQFLQLNAQCLNDAGISKIVNYLSFEYGPEQFSDYFPNGNYCGTQPPLVRGNGDVINVETRL